MVLPLWQVDERLKDWATERQAALIDAINEHKSLSAAARALNWDLANASRSLLGLRRRAAQQGYAPGHWEQGVAPGFAMGKVTIQRGPKGIERTWERQLPEADTLARLKVAAEAMAEELPRLDPLERPGHVLAKLCNLYTFTDFHMGMLAKNGGGGGADWDMDIAERTLLGVFEQMILQAPRARVAVINQLGDFLHWDGLDPVTPTHQNPLDAAARYDELVKVSIRVLRRIIDIALMRHEEVHVVMAEGNHDLSGSVWLRQMFAVLYENDPRVTVNLNPLPYYAFRHGSVFLGFHHGHKKKKEALPLLFAAMFREMWGQTRKGYIHTGHYHEVDEKEFPGVKVIQHPTLAAPDSHTGRSGYLSDREATADTYHEDFGRVARTTVTPEMLEAA